MKTIDRIMRVFHFRILQKGRWIYRPKPCVATTEVKTTLKVCEVMRVSHVCSMNYWNNCHHENVNWKRHFLLIREWNIQMANRDNIKYCHGISQAHIFFHSLIIVFEGEWLTSVHISDTINIIGSTYILYCYCA